MAQLHTTFFVSRLHCGKYTLRRGPQPTMPFLVIIFFSSEVTGPTVYLPHFMDLDSSCIPASCVTRDHIDSTGHLASVLVSRESPQGKALSSRDSISPPGSELHAGSPIYRSGRRCSSYPERGVGLAFGGCSILSLSFLFVFGFPASLQTPPVCTCTMQRCVRATGGCDFERRRCSFSTFLERG